MIITLVLVADPTFTPGIVKSIALRKDELDVDEIRLYDINEERQRQDWRCSWTGFCTRTSCAGHQAHGDHRQKVNGFHRRELSCLLRDAAWGGYAMREQDEKDSTASRLRGSGDLRLRRPCLRHAHHLPHGRADR